MHEDLLADLARISAQHYDTDFDLHMDISNSFARLRDGHCVYINACYDGKSTSCLVILKAHYLQRSLCTANFVSFVPIPAVLLTEADGTQNIHIAPEAFAVSSLEFGDEMQFWQNALPDNLKGQLETVRMSPHATDSYEALIFSSALWCCRA